jgi:hypothetical protein
MSDYDYDGPGGGDELSPELSLVNDYFGEDASSAGGDGDVYGELIESAGDELALVREYAASGFDADEVLADRAIDAEIAAMSDDELDAELGYYNYDEDEEDEDGAYAEPDAGGLIDLGNGLQAQHRRSSRLRWRGRVTPPRISCVRGSRIIRARA